MLIYNIPNNITNVLAILRIIRFFAFQKFNDLLRNVIKKGGGIRPKETLATL
ncbi:hypothetical protein P278_21950 [Zhouia amylolytica AD3]|uniref:Uncharacterized protein n=1 Tax=Zhouia amylolytica AD3 TaxID=1286632 RepID=W2UNW9_9FLAO|nr:hypothetical protein P278_21950 [Zhouia amylolytica AD3]